jgi:hypothetical protein
MVVVIAVTVKKRGALKTVGRMTMNKVKMTLKVVKPTTCMGWNALPYSD